jgi:uroporphyrinogen-III synthase
LPTILSTKTLTVPQQELILNTGLGLVHYDILEIEQCDLKSQPAGDALIITSKNAIGALEKLNSRKPIFCVGEITAGLLDGFDIKYIAKNAVDLAGHIIQYHASLSYDYLCGSQRREELPHLLTAQNIVLKEYICYHSHEVSRRFDRIFAAVLFYSPRGVIAFAKANSTSHTSQNNNSKKIMERNERQSLPREVKVKAICIGNTTATEARKYFKKVHVAKRATLINTIVTAIKSLKNDPE